jgi:hypothetical protein
MEIFALFLLNDSVEFSDAIEHGGIIYAVDEPEGRMYSWDL